MSDSKKWRGILASVYKKAGSDYDCTMNGISNAFDRVLVLTDEGPDVVSSEASNVYPVVQIKMRQMGGREVFSAHVIFDPRNPDIDYSEKWGMMGGNYISSSDSRFSELKSFYGAVALHDRFEN